LFNPLILSFGEAIGLRVECGRQVLFGSDLTGQYSAEVRCETGVSVGDDLQGKPEPSVHIIEVQLGDSRAHDCCGTGKEDSRSGASVIYDH